MIPVSRRESYLKQPVSMRLGGLSANLARLASIAEIPEVKAVYGLLEESKVFIEWIIPDFLDTRLDDAAYLVEVQRALARWQHIWPQSHTDPVQRRQLAEQAREWSIEILYLSGLVDE